MLVEIQNQTVELVELDLREPLYFSDGPNLYKMDDKSIAQVTEDMLVEWKCDGPVYISIAGRYAKGEFKVIGRSEFEELLVVQAMKFSQHLEA